MYQNLESELKIFLFSIKYHVQRHSLVGSRYENHDLSRVHYGANADGQSLFRHLLDVVVEKPRVGVDRLLEIGDQMR